MTTATTTESTNQIETVVKAQGLIGTVAQSLIDKLVPLVADAGEVVREAEGVIVTDATQVSEIKRSRALRLKLKDIRVAVEKVRKAEKEESLRVGQRIDAVANHVKGLIEPTEARLQEQEDFAERQEAARKVKLASERSAVLVPFGIDPAIYGDLGGMATAAWDTALSGVKAAHEARIAREAKEAEERAAAERLRQEELAKAQAEAAQLRQEAEAREAAAKVERERVEAERAAERAKAEADRKAVEAKARKEREAAEAVAKKEREDREVAEAKLKAEKDAAEKRAAAERKAALAAALAPEKIKLKVMAALVRQLPAPEMDTPKGKAALAEVLAKAEAFAKWIETQAESLS